MCHINDTSMPQECPMSWLTNQPTLTSCVLISPVVHCTPLCWWWESSLCGPHIKMLSPLSLPITRFPPLFYGQTVGVWFLPIRCGLWWCGCVLVGCMCVPSDRLPFERCRSRDRARVLSPCRRNFVGPTCAALPRVMTISCLGLDCVKYVSPS